MRQKEIIKRCAKCDSDDVKLRPMEGGYICESCCEAARKGRDDTTRATRALKAANTEQATANLYRLRGNAEAAESHQSEAYDFGDKSNELFAVKQDFVIASGEAVRANRSGGVIDTLKAPDVVALDASAHRIELLSNVGNDCIALALDAAESIKAGNSLERMLAHQLAVAHKIALELTDKAQFQQEPVEKARLLNAAARFMDVFQRGLLTLQRLRNGGEQKITINHVNVGEGGQAVVGSVQTGGQKTK